MKKAVVPFAMALIAFGIGAVSSSYFLDARYLLDRSALYVEPGLLALAMTLVIVAGHIDLSVASTLALVACVTTKLLGAGIPALAALPAGLALGAALGGFNGYLVAKLRLPSFVVTLATMAAYRGAAQVLVGSESAKVPANLTGIDFATVPGTPIPVLLVVLAVAAVLVGLLLHRTVFGRWLYAIGTNERATYLSGVPTARTLIGVFALSGLISGFAGLVMASRFGVARYDHGLGMEVEAITAVVLGGASISGGSGTILGTVAALILMIFVRTGMGVADVPAEHQLAAIGTLLVVAVVISNLVERFAQRRLRTVS